MKLVIGGNGKVNDMARRMHDPVDADSAVAKIEEKIRRILTTGPRYVIVSGSSSAPMAWGRDKAAAFVIVESELDGLLLNQEAGDLAGVVAMGSAQANPDRITHAALTAAAVILVSLDTDDAGARAAWAFWPERYGGKAKR